jgi:hypothetical protein
MIGSTPANLPLGNGCTLLLNPLVSLASLTNAAGIATLPLPIPNNLFLKGASIYSSGAIIDPGGKAFNVAAIANGMRIIIGD